MNQHTQNAERQLIALACRTGMALKEIAESFRIPIDRVIEVAQTQGFDDAIHEYEESLVPKSE